ncbi:MAG: hypothetical protein KAJ24_05430, partial [Candidatus Aenigmarchaeota archaeon]|nr:hypothetical protein [Candidatus Aenigmarchaeota archaeon]
GFEFVLLDDKNYFYVSRTKELAKKAMYYELNIIKFYNSKIDFEFFCNDVRNLGALLGFPDCCVEFYLSCWLEQGTNILERTEPEPNYIHYSHRNTGNPAKIDFRMNNLFIYRTMPFFPCSYECPAAMQFAAKVFEKLPAKQKELTRQSLTGDFLVIDEYNLIGFESRYRFRENCIDYNPEGVRFFNKNGSLFEPAKKGNKIEFNDNRIRIFGENGEKISEIFKHSYLLRFY